MKRVLYLVRHAQSNPSGDVPPALWPLSPKGRDQASRLIDVLTPLKIDFVFSSPYLRCLQTISPFVRQTGMSVEQRPNLREVEIVKSLRVDFSDIWRRAWQDFDYALPGCESHRNAQERFIGALHALHREVPEGTVAVCSHGAVIGLLLHAICPGVGRAQAEALTNPDVLRILVENEAWTWDRTFQPSGLSDSASHHDETPINWDPPLERRR